MRSLNLFRSFNGRLAVKAWTSKPAMGCVGRRLLSTSLPGPDGSGSSDLQLSYTTYPDQEHSVDPMKKPLIFLHGLFGAKGNLHSMSKHLADDGRKVITYDARNHGDSHHSQEMNFDCMADDLDNLIGDLNLTSPVVMGHSMGGKTAMNFSLLKPDKVEALIVVDVTPSKSPGIDELIKFAKAMREVKIAAETSLVQARQQAQIQLSPIVTNRFVLQFLLTNLRQFEGGEVRWRNNLDAFINNSGQIGDFPLQTASPFKKPTLFVYGENSAHYRELDVDKVKTLFPQAEFKTIKDAGHFVHVDQPLEFVRVVREFLQTMDGTSS